MLAAAANQYDEQVRITTLALRQSQRQAVRGSRVVARTIATYQALAVNLAVDSAPDVLAEQGIPTTASSDRVSTASLLTSSARSAAMLDQATTNAAFERIVAALVNDAGRTGSLTDMGRREAVTGYVRSLRPPSCSRCAVLAGRVYRYNQGFQRHPHCDCLMTPTDQDVGPSLVTDPQEAIDKGWVQGLSKADAKALDAGADLGQVVNVRRQAAGLTVGSSVMVRAGRLTPQGCLMFSSDRADALGLLKKYGYLT